MDLKSTENLVSIALFTIKASESEMQACETCISYVLEHLKDDDLEALTEHTREELEDVRDDLLAFILAHTLEEFLPDRYRRIKEAQKPAGEQENEF